MSIKSFASKQFSTHLLDERRRDKARARAERERRRKGEPHRIEFFHQVDDPYSHLLAQALVKVQDRYDVEVVTWLVEPPEDWAAPARALLESYSLVDARRLAEKAGFHATSETPPRSEKVLEVQRELAATLPAPGEPGARATLEAAVMLAKGLWEMASAASDSLGPDAAASGDPSGSRPEGRRTQWVEDATTDAALQVALRAGTERRAELGHYLGGTCFYGGEWTWGIDRLAYLEERLADLGARRSAGDPDAGTAGQKARATAGAPTAVAPIYEQPRLLEEPVPVDGLEAANLPDLHFFASFRSPYTWISTERVIRLAEAFGVNLRIRFVLPMVMRGLPVKRSKRVYILLDAAREARRNGVPFGPISDPVGKPVERGYSLLPWAIEQGKGIEYFRSFMTLAFSQAVDAGSDRGLRRIVEEAGLDWSEGRGYLDDPAWREEAERNREELFDLGLWGVPSFRVGSVAAWGQDRLWVLEDEYRRLALRRE
ncbi:MAG: DsbA family protein [Acidobacteria bacterium]|nr:DsbA family protein [Acidobacteriota bacterium]